MFIIVLKKICLSKIQSKKTRVIYQSRVARCSDSGDVKRITRTSRIHAARIHMYFFKLMVYNTQLFIFWHLSMVFVACGLNHTTASLAVREQVASSTQHNHLLQRLIEQPDIDEAVVLSTCNRTEIYCDIHDPSRLIPLLAHLLSFERSEIRSSFYLYTAHQAIHHLLRVTSGLDSMMLGEPQIFGQIKQAYQLAAEVGGIGSTLSYLFPYVFKASKRIRNQSEIGKNPISVAYAAVQLLLQQSTPLNHLTAFLIGSGETASLVAKYLAENGVSRFFIANRTIESAAHLAAQYQGQIVPIVDIPLHLSAADVVISATSCPLPFINKRMVERALAQRSQPMFMLDLAVPRDIEPDVGDVPGVHLYNIDDLHLQTEIGRQKRQMAAIKAEQLVEIEVENYLRWHRSLKAKQVICDYRDQMRALADMELDRAKQKLSSGQALEDVLHEFSKRLVNKLTHLPTLGLRQAALDDQHQILDLAQSLLIQKTHEKIT